MRQARSYDNEFKVQAVKLSKEIGTKKTGDSSRDAQQMEPCCEKIRSGRRERRTHTRKRVYAC